VNTDPTDRSGPPSAGPPPPLPPAPAAGGLPTFDQVFFENAPYVCRALRRLGVRAADVEDVAQEVFLVVHRKLGTFQGRSSVRTWLYGISIRSASEYRRRPYQQEEELVDRVPDRGARATQDTELDRQRALALLDAALDKLDADKRAVFVLYELEEMAMAEVAEAVGCPLQTAYSRLYAARKIVEAAMQRGMTARSPR
jgi:RNA polymerase sigma-70 factor, ECF subfamily